MLISGWFSSSRKAQVIFAENPQLKIMNVQYCGLEYLIFTWLDKAVKVSCKSQIGSSLYILNNRNLFLCLEKDRLVVISVLEGSKICS